MAQNAALQAGSLVYVALAKGGWRKGVVDEVADGVCFVVFDSGEEVEADADAVLFAEEGDDAAVDQVLDLYYLHEASLFSVLESRFSRDEIYTNLGSTLISVNPFQPLPLYTADVIAKYRCEDPLTLPPHLYGFGSRVYGTLLQSRESQVVYLSGEVGAGKTEASKLLIKFLSSLEPRSAERKPTVCELMLLSNPIWEAFACARTVANPNSSRCGRFTQLYYDPLKGSVVGGRLLSYSFEQTRVTDVPPKERNFHVFYQLLAGASPEDKKSFFLLAPARYRYLAGTKHSDSAEEDAAGFSSLKKSMAVLGMGTKKQSAIFRTLAAILHLGNISFDYNEQSDAVSVRSEKTLKIVCHLLGCDEKELARVLCAVPPMAALDDEEPPGATQSNEDARDRLAQALYGALFRWLLYSITHRLSPPAPPRSDGSSRAGRKNKDGSGDPRDLPFIGVLDPLGFELSDDNKLTQLTTNYSSDFLYAELVEAQQSAAQQLYDQDGLDWTPLALPRASEFVNAFDRPKGVWDALRRVTSDEDAVDLDFLDTLFADNADEPLLENLAARYEFRVGHFGGDVTYNALRILATNRRAVAEGLDRLMQDSKSGFVRVLFSSTKYYNAYSSTDLLRRELARIVKAVKRCGARIWQVASFLPNLELAPNAWNATFMQTQLQTAGLLESAKFMTEGYPRHYAYTEFLRRFRVLLPPQAKLSGEPRTDTGKVLKALLFKMARDEQWAFGRSRIFLKPRAAMALERRLSACYVSAADTIKAAILGASFAARLRRILATAPRASPARSVAARRKGSGGDVDRKLQRRVSPREKQQHYADGDEQNGVTARKQSNASSNEAVEAQRRGVAQAVVQLTKGSIELVSLVYEADIDRGQVFEKVRQLKGHLAHFGDNKSAVGNTASYRDACSELSLCFSDLLDAVKAVCRERNDRTELQQECKAVHGDFVEVVRQWRKEYAYLERKARSQSARAVRSSTGSSGGKRSAPPQHRAPVPPSAESSSNGTSTSPGKKTKKWTSHRKPVLSRANSELPWSSARSKGLRGSHREASSSRSDTAAEEDEFAASSAPAASFLMSPRAGRLAASAKKTRKVFYHDSPMMRRHAKQRDAVGKAAGTRDATIMKATLDKFDAEMAQEALKKESCIVHLDLPDGSRVRVKAPTRQTATEIKAYCLTKAQQYSRAFENAKPADYVLAALGMDHIIPNDNAPLTRMAFVQACAKTFIMPVFDMMHRREWQGSSSNDIMKEQAQELTLHSEVSQLVGKELQEYLKLENDEISRFRSAMTHARLDYADELAQAAQEGQLFMLHEYKEAEPMPPRLPTNIRVNLHLPLEGAEMGASVLMFTPSDTANQVLERAVLKLRKLDLKRKSARPEDFLLKITSWQSFLLGDTAMLDYDYVRSCICAEVPVELSLVDKQRTLDAYPNEQIARNSFLDRTLESWIYDNPIIYDSDNSDVLNKETLQQFDRPWRIKINGVQGVPAQYLYETDTGNKWYCFVRVSLFQGDGPLMQTLYTKPVEVSDKLRWDQWLFLLPISNLSRGSRFSFSVRVLEAPTEPTLIDETLVEQSFRIGWLNVPVWDQHGRLLPGDRPWACRLWRGDETYDITCLDNAFAETTLYVRFEETTKSIIYRESPFALPRSVSDPTFASKQGIIRAILEKDPLEALGEREKQMLWEFRHSLKDNARALPKVLKSTQWSDYSCAQEMYALMRDWCELEPSQALQLVSGDFLDPAVRRQGVKFLERLSDGDLLMFLPQLCQALKWEPYHDSALAKFLIRRALRCRHRIGHMFFWHLKSEMHLPKIAARYGLMLEAYLRGAGTHRKELVKQNDVVNQLVDIAKGLKEQHGSTARMEFLRKRLRSMRMPKRFQLPLDPRYEVKGLMVEKCKFMDSKKVPLWLVFENAEDIGNPIIVIFKEGDDLRQDILTIQMLRLMSNLWKQHGLDLGMNPYGCIATGDETGMIEVVMNAATTAGIARQAGGVKAIFRNDVLAKWLKQHNKSVEQWRLAQRNFLRSCAAYCVATYVLGIGDRHNDNIMCQKDGHFFHIDFGHFLGNYKKKFGIERERAPFIFTPQYAEVLGGRKSPMYREFVKLAGDLYNIIRKNADLFITLFNMMTLTGIPELQTSKDIDWLRNALNLHLTDSQAARLFADLIEEAYRTKTTLVNDAFHVAVHRK